MGQVAKMTAAISTEQAERIACRLARQQVMAAGKFLTVAGSDVYQVKAGWECAQLQQDPNVARASTVVEFESAVQDPEQVTVFIPKNATITQETLERVLARNSQDKTVFWEA